MCFRPAETELPPATCPSCGKRINRVAGQLPTEMPLLQVADRRRPRTTRFPSTGPRFPGSRTDGHQRLMGCANGSDGSAPKAPGAPISKYGPWLRHFPASR